MNIDNMNIGVKNSEILNLKLLLELHLKPLQKHTSLSFPISDLVSLQNVKFSILILYLTFPLLVTATIHGISSKIILINS